MSLFKTVTRRWESKICRALAKGWMNEDFASIHRRYVLTDSQQLPHSCWSHAFSCSVATGGFTLGVTRLDREASHLPPPDIQSLRMSAAIFSLPLISSWRAERQLDPYGKSTLCKHGYYL